MLLIQIINLIYTILFILILLYVILSFVVSPYDRFRSAIDKIVEPLLTPIRKIVQPISGIDFSPVIFLVLIQIIRRLVIGLLQ